MLAMGRNASMVFMIYYSSKAVLNECLRLLLMCVYHINVCIDDVIYSGCDRIVLCFVHTSVVQFRLEGSSSRLEIFEIRLEFAACMIVRECRVY